ncbi:NAD-dependent epimerase/dehydratase family protein [Actinomadura litoris]|uniref:NAD-dependent epimerase/dehydratase family protein n=1 Tax=Actinomadura litoris TaxID=2678616 RepID=UPI001FA7F30C|nr:NAD(P)-dependent oxidoreductase [Actinomadura litoris]
MTMNAERILITGAAGLIGSFLRPRLARPGRTLRLLDIADMGEAAPGEEPLRASVTDLAALERACEGVDAIVHLGGLASEAPWNDIADVNINGTYNIYEAARRTGVGRVVFASSNHAAGFHPSDEAPAPDYLFPAPDTYYGVSKVTGEALGSLYHSRYGLDVIAIRILTCNVRPPDLRSLATWLSPGDAARLFEASLSVPSPGFRVVWGVSANTRGWFSLDEARAIGYEPQDDAEPYAAELTERFGTLDPESPDARWLGGRFCGPDFGV